MIPLPRTQPSQSHKENCKTFFACPDCDGDVGVVEGVPSDASSDVDLTSFGENSSDDDSD
jgi:hypothetical protein